MGPRTKAAFDVLRRRADESGYGSFISDQSLEQTAMEIVNAIRPRDLFRDVHDFHVKFGLPTGGAKTAILDEATRSFRINFMREELTEFVHASAIGDVAQAVDGLCDLVYVALGTAVMMGAPFNACWDEVQRANMSKVRATGADDPRSTRQNALDVVKPAGWQPPNLKRIIDAQTS